MINPGDAAQLVGATAYSSDGEKVGKIGQVFFDDRTGEVAWASVSTGLFGLRESLAPLDGADFDGTDVHLTFSKDRIKDAPNVDPAGDRILESDERELYSFYDLEYGTEAYAYGTTADEGYSGSRSSGDWQASAAEAAPPASGSAEDAQYGAPTSGLGSTGDWQASARDAVSPASGSAEDAQYGAPTAGAGSTGDWEASRREAVTPAAGSSVGAQYEPATPARPGTAVPAFDASGPPPDAATIERAEQVADAAEQRFRVRLRKYLGDPSIATLPVSEQAEAEDAAVADAGVEDRGVGFEDRGVEVVDQGVEDTRSTAERPL